MRFDEGRLFGSSVVGPGKGTVGKTRPGEQGRLRSGRAAGSSRYCRRRVMGPGEGPCGCE